MKGFTLVLLAALLFSCQAASRAQVATKTIVANVAVIKGGTVWLQAQVREARTNRPVGAGHIVRFDIMPGGAYYLGPGALFAPTDGNGIARVQYKTSGSGILVIPYAWVLIGATFNGAYPYNRSYGTGILRIYAP